MQYSDLAISVVFLIKIGKPDQIKRAVYRPLGRLTELCRTETEFMRVHNSFIINLSKVSRYLKGSDEIILNNEVKVPLSKSRKESFFTWLRIGGL